MSRFPAVIGVGASAGGVEALTSFVAALPKDLAAPVLVVLHIAPSGTSVLSSILARRTALPVRDAEDGLRVEGGTVYVALPDRHLKLVDGHIRLDRDPRVNGHRPALDPMLRSIAAAYGARGVGVVLSGTRDDGAMGLVAVKAAGGRAFVQDLDEAQYRAMPANALDAVEADGCLLVAEIARRVAALTGADTPAAPEDPPLPDQHDATRITCPDCGGVLFHEVIGGTERYACSVGHEYAPDSLTEENARHLESALWAAVRSLDDRADLLDRLARRADRQSHDRVAARHRAEQTAVLGRRDLIRDVISEARSEPDAA